MRAGHRARRALQAAPSAAAGPAPSMGATSSDGTVVVALPPTQRYPAARSDATPPANGPAPAAKPPAVVLKPSTNPFSGNAVVAFNESIPPTATAEMACRLPRVEGYFTFHLAAVALSANPDACGRCIVLCSGTDERGACVPTNITGAGAAGAPQAGRAALHRLPPTADQVRPTLPLRSLCRSRRRG